MPGPFYFAWIDAPVAFNAAVHNVEDEFILNFSVQHDEGDFPTASLTFKNPRVGLLSRPVWAWLSWDKNWVPAQDHVPDIIPIFLGRLLGLPNNLFGEVITIDLVARPQDYHEQRQVVADALRVLPQWDPIWISADHWEDNDTVLEGYTRLWHFDRVSHVVTTSDIIVGEDGIAEIEESEIPYESVSMTLSQAPFRSVLVEGTAKWTQRDAGKFQVLDKYRVHALNGATIISGWPKKGSSIDGGYRVKESECVDLNGVEDMALNAWSSSWQSANDEPSPGDTMSASYSSNLLANYYTGASHAAAPQPPPLTMKTTMGVGKASFDAQFLYVLGYNLQCTLHLAYEVGRGRTEIARFIIESNLQPVLTDPTSVDQQELKISSNDVDIAIDDDIPIGNVGRASFFETDRGQGALQYLMCRARAMLTSAGRCVEVSAKIPFARAIELSCRQNGIINDARIPGGQALGKIKSYSFSCEDSGEMSGTITIACAIGYGQAIDAVPGVPVYVDEGYVDPGYQMYEGAIIVLPGDNLGYEVPLFAGTDDGIKFPLTKSQVVVKSIWHNTDQEQSPSVGSKAVVADGAIITQEQAQDEVQAAQDLINAGVAAYPVWYELELKNINGKFTNDYDVTVTLLELPKQIDLEFSAS